jgi:transcriptional regulator with XRE-family HTH domain
VAEGAGITKSYLFGLENGSFPLPSLPHLRGIARGLEVDEADLLAAAGHLPDVGPYLRAKYDLPEPSAEQVEDFVRFMRQRAQEEGGRDEPSRDADLAA